MMGILKLIQIVLLVISILLLISLKNEDKLIQKIIVLILNIIVLIIAWIY